MLLRARSATSRTAARARTSGSTATRGPGVLPEGPKVFCIGYRELTKRAERARSIAALVVASVVAGVVRPLRSLRTVDGGDHHPRGLRGTSELGRKRGAPRRSGAAVAAAVFGASSAGWARCSALRGEVAGPPGRSASAARSRGEAAVAGPGAAAPPTGPRLVADVLLPAGDRVPVRGGPGRRVPHLPRDRRARRGYRGRGAVGERRWLGAALVAPFGLARRPLGSGGRRCGPDAPRRARPW